MKTALPRPPYIVKRSALQRQQTLCHRMSCGTSQEAVSRADMTEKWRDSDT